MKQSMLTLIILFSSLAISAQKQLSNTYDWHTMVAVSKSEGVNTSGFYVEFLQNKNNWWGDWLIPWRASLQLTDLRNERFNKTNYRQITMGHATFGVGGLKPLSDRVTLSVDGGVVLGGENLVQVNGRTNDHFYIGLSSFQGILFFPSKQWALVLKAGIYEEFLTSKVYGVDIGLQIGLGIRF